MRNIVRFVIKRIGVLKLQLIKFFFLSIVPIITSVLTVVNRMADTQSFTVIYTPTPFEVSTFDMYRFVLSDPTIPVKEKPAEDSDRKVITKCFIKNILQLSANGFAGESRVAIRINKQ